MTRGIWNRSLYFLVYVDRSYAVKSPLVRFFTLHLGILVHACT